MSTAKDPQSYAEAVDRAHGIIRAGRLADPGEHFPYKHATVATLVEENPPMGPGGPDDDQLRAEDYMSANIADASGAYVDAQAEYLSNPGDGTREAYRAAAVKLQAARAAHRANRPAGPTIVGIRARRAGE